MEEILPEVVILTLMEEEKLEVVEKRIEEVELKSQEEEEEEEEEMEVKSHQEEEEEEMY